MNANSFTPLIIFLLGIHLYEVKCYLTPTENLTITDLENNVLYLNKKVKTLLQKEKEQAHTDAVLKDDISSVFSTLHTLLKDSGQIGSPNPIGNDGLVPSVSDCGGVLVSSKGYLVFRSNLDHSKRTTCTWTIRVNASEKISIRLVSDNFPHDDAGQDGEGGWPLATLGIAPLHGMMRENLTTFAQMMWMQSTLYAGDRNEYEFEGSTLFLSLIVNCTKSPHFKPSFVLSFKGIGDPEKYSDKKFTHFHYTSSSGSVSYPLSGGEEYENNEVATFVINPPHCKGCDTTTNGELVVLKTYLGIQNSSDCSGDYLSEWQAIKEHGGIYQKRGFGRQQYRFCGDYGIISPLGFGEYSERYIFFFVSDSKGTGTGFQFRWNS